MLRFLFPLVSLLIAVFSIGVDLFPRQPDSGICLHGGCRIDQTDSTVLAAGATPAAAKALLVEDSADPTMWCGYGEFLSTAGQSENARAAFDRAVALGPGMSPVLMRVANFNFTHERTEEGLRLAARILSQTEEFDQLLFSYLQNARVPIARILGDVVPATPRPARSWLGWVRSRGSDRDVVDTWAWIRRNHLEDERSAVETASTLWQRKAHRSAQELWADWMGARRGDYPRPQLLIDTHFEEQPSGTPFDWNLSPASSVAYIRRNGLDVRFLGQENVDFRGVQQSTAIDPGRYRFTAEIDAEDLTTDQGPFFQIVDAENPGRLTAESRPILGAISRSSVVLDFVVPQATRVLTVQLVRRPSLKFDCKISGTMHIYGASLLKLR